MKPFAALLVIPALVVAADTSAARHASNVTLTCPAEIQVEQKLAAPEKGWESLREGVSHRLADMALFSGHPSELAELIPDNADEEGPSDPNAPLVSIWTLGPAGAGSGYWIECRYRNTDVALARFIGRDVRYCETNDQRQVPVWARPALTISCK